MTNTILIIIIASAVLLTALLTYLAVALASARKNRLDTSLMMEMLKAQMTAESERVLKAREQELEQRATALFENLSAGLDKDINSMKDAFEKNRMAHVAASQTLKANIDNAVRNGYTIAWGADVSEDGFTRNGVAIVPDMEKAADFTLMAATLLEIKSKQLLPKPEVVGEQDVEDPEEKLYRQLEEYKLLSKMLKERQN